MVLHPSHEIPFEYDNALIESCASFVVAHGLVVAIMSDNTTPTSYATSSSSKQEQGNSTSSTSTGTIHHCQILFHLHATHYQRPNLTPAEEHFWKSWMDTTIDNIIVRHDANNNEAYYADKTSASPSPRIRAFLQSVVFVHGHNNNQDVMINDGQTDASDSSSTVQQRRKNRKRNNRSSNQNRHEVALNRFSDLTPGELPLMHSSPPSSHKNKSATSPWEYLQTLNLDKLVQPKSLESWLNELTSHDQNNQQQQTLPQDNTLLNNINNKPLFMQLYDEHMISKIGEKIIRNQRAHQRQQHPTYISDMRNNAASLSSNLGTNIFQSVREAWWWIGGGWHPYDDDDNNDDNASSIGNRKSREENNREELTEEDVDESSQVGQQLDKQQQQQQQHSHSSKHYSPSSSSSPLLPSPESKSKHNSFLLDKQNELGGLQEEDGNNRSNDGGNKNWDSYLNWSTEDNPDGIPIVHSVMDQGLCGSCWAIAATGSLEASIARNMAYIAYEEAYSSIASSSSRNSNGNVVNARHTSGGGGSNNNNNNSNNNKNINTQSSKNDGQDPRTLSILAAQQIERQSIHTADLSVQELVDCDTRYDQGCAGGNPLLAFYFLHRYGVTSTANYPYTGSQGSCQYKKVDQPIATVETWGILTPDHEDNMEKVLRYIGPVAVGLNGADPSFLSYKGGVFQSRKGGGRCDSGVADHAMLIVGYGQDVAKDGTKTKYWIARNSWGSGWGEKGYVKMARTDGKKGSRGVCGIARSPSVALGGMFSEDVELLAEDDDDMYYGSRGHTKGESSHEGRSGHFSNKARISRASSQIQSIIHRIRSHLGFVQKGIMMSTIDGSEGSNNMSTILPYSLMMGFISCCFLLTFVHRTRRRNHHQNRQLNERNHDEESVATDWSHTAHAGEQTSLLQNASGPTYNT